ncbi:DUF2627 family protein [Virgibacillus soli]|uniref:DUF2627 family protein n=1 Tax=Paracerasibacillus soli TaxID=480284 RepID=A0ABU5CPW8_9BACI|nr:DUF2627 family protein [Virgibacillus soli]MDY0408391.1 DUF2627 family protein [Virgibacillus soli]
MARIIAFMLLLIPGVLSAIGIKLMRDTLFDEYVKIFINPTIQFIIGFIIFVGGLAFIGGFIFHRDKKQQQKHK